MDKFDFSTYLALDSQDESFLSISITSKDYDLLGVSSVIYDFIDNLKDYLRGVDLAEEKHSDFDSLERGSMI